ncbi:hypothetical protein ACFL6G_05405 [candidate division KSB1 bacterium]
MECPFCGKKMREGGVTVFETLGGKLTRLGVLPLFVGESWKKLRFREKGIEDNDKFIRVPFSRSEYANEGFYCMTCASVIIKRLHSLLSS